MLRFASIIAAFALLCLPPLRVDATCYTGGTPGWGDIPDVEIDRCQPTNISYACYHAILGAAGGQRGIDGYLVVYRMSGRRGTYVLDTSKTSSEPWSEALQAIKDADFFNLNVPDPTPGPYVVTVYVDGPWNQIIVHRCHAHVSIDADITYDKTAAGYTRFMALVERLDKIVQTLPWQKKSDRVAISDVLRHFGP